jgi:glutamate formiminotransferase
VPIQHATTADCVALARELAETIARRFELPVYLYEDAATTPGRRHLEVVRRGQFERLAERMKEPGWQPDFGPARPHPSAGATVVGVRPILIAYNINLDTSDLEIAREIASAVRERGGGLPFVKAMAVDLAPQPVVQVSMNVTNYEATPLNLVFETVQREAARRGVTIRDSEIVGMVPVGALLPAAVRALQLERFRVEQVLERRLGSTLSLPPHQAS